MAPERHDFSGDEDSCSVIEQEAANWLIRRDHGLNPTQQQEFNRWLHSDERHAAVYAELAETWGLIGQVTAIDAPAPASVVSQTNWRTPLLWLAAAAAVALVFFFRQPSSSPTAGDFILTDSTEIGAIRTLSLPDGSLIQLNTDSLVAVRFTATERRVTLQRGEAHFQVAKNPARPFIVTTGAIDVRAVGTAFDVRQRPATVEVLVTEGKVRVEDNVAGKSRLPASTANDQPPLLVAGERAYISVGATETPARVVAVAPGEISQVLAWQSHRLEFVATPLAEMVEEFNRYNRHKLVIADSRLAGRRFGGTFPAGDYEEFVRVLESDFGIVAERDQNEIRLKLAL